MSNKLSLKSCMLVFLVFALRIEVNSQNNSDLFPENHLDLENPIGYETLKQFGERVQAIDFIDVTIEGKTLEDRSLFLYHLYRGTGPSKWKVFFFAQQHGNEPAGKDALLYLIKYIAENPALLPENVDLWILPMVNPDGAEKDQRRNSAGSDLNRDHLVLSQIETQILHKVCRKIMPHVSVDCHEFTRDSRDYTEKGWLEWPLIMMDCANNPAYGHDLYNAGVSWVNQAAEYMQAKGHNYTRYYVGGLPPDEELRHSTLEIDDARNGLGAYQGLSFIVESGVIRGSGGKHSDLAQRVDAYLDLLTRFLYDSKKFSGHKKIIKDARQRPVPDFLPVNYFWGSAGQTICRVKVIDQETKQTQEISTANFMSDLIVKNNVRTPQAYIIEEKFAASFAELLGRHAIKYEVLQERKFFMAQMAKLDSIEDFRDKVYNRYAGRQVVSLDTLKQHDFEAGCLMVDLKQEAGLRAAIILEPAKLYGLFAYPDFAEMAAEDKTIPIWRIFTN